MISYKELQHVNSFASKAPFPGEDYAKKTLEDMQKSFEEFNSRLRDKSFSIIFSDASECEFEVFEQNLCHLLGVDYKWLTSGNYDDVLREVLGMDLYERYNSYTLLNKILENQDDVIRYDKQATFRILNYYKALIKSSIFKRVGELENFNFGMIDTESGAKFLYMPSPEYVCPYFWVLIDKDAEFNSKYYVKSLFAPLRSELKDYFNKASGDSVIPTQIIVDDMRNLRKTVASPEDKLDMLKLHDSISQITGEPIKVEHACDYEATLEENVRLQEEIKRLKMRGNN